MFPTFLPFTQWRNIALFSFYAFTIYAKYGTSHFWAHFWKFGAWGRFGRVHFHCFLIPLDVSYISAFYTMKKYCVVLILCLYNICEIWYVPLLGPFLKIWGLGPIWWVHFHCLLVPRWFLHFCLLHNEKILCCSHFIWFNILMFHKLGPILGVPVARGRIWANLIRSMLFLLTPHYINSILPFTEFKNIKFVCWYLNFCICLYEILKTSEYKWQCNRCEHQNTYRHITFCLQN